MPLAQKAASTSPAPPTRTGVNGKASATPVNGKDDDDETPSSDSEDDKPIAAKKQQQPKKAPAAAAAAKANGKKKSAPPKKSNKSAEDSSSEDDAPLSSLASTSRRASAPQKRMKEESSDDDDESEEEEEEESEEDIKPKKGKKKAPPPAKKAKTAPAKRATPVATKPKKEDSVTPAKPAKGKQKEKEGSNDNANDDEDEDQYKWWLQQQDSSKKWSTLEHNGVMFPPEYESHGVKMLYNGKKVDLPPEAEEVMTFFAALIESDHAKNPTFVKNFFHDWQQVLKTHPPRDGTQIKSFDACDFRPVWEHLDAERQAKKSLSAAEKKANKAKRDEEEAPFKFCLLDGRKEKLGNFRVEPPGLFRGRGEHPKTGMLKHRVMPEDITINIGKGAKVPEPPAGHKWGGVQHDDSVTWLATWKENINGNVK